MQNSRSPLDCCCVEPSGAGCCEYAVTAPLCANVYEQLVTAPLHDAGLSQQPTVVSDGVPRRSTGLHPDVLRTLISVATPSVCLHTSYMVQSGARLST